MRTVRMEEMTWPDIKAAIEQGFTTAVVGVGSTEQHGPHLPTMTDARIGEGVAHLVALKLGDALQARTVDVGVSEHHLAFAGTLSLRPETLKMILRDYVDSLVRSGFKRIVFVPTHGGNFATVERVIVESREAHKDVEVTGYTDLFGLTGFLNELSAEHGITAEESGAHAGESETSIMMALERDLVVPEHFAPGYLGPVGESEFKVIVERGMPALSSSGVLGDPRKASAEKGRIYLERLADFLVEKVRQKAARR